MNRTTNEYVTIKLTKNQALQLSSIVGAAYMQERCNCLFICTAAADNGSWRMQVAKFPLSVYKKLMKLIPV
jgi:hypothetical protein